MRQRIIKRFVCQNFFFSFTPCFNYRISFFLRSLVVQKLFFLKECFSSSTCCARGYRLSPPLTVGFEHFTRGELLSFLALQDFPSSHYLSYFMFLIKFVPLEKWKSIEYKWQNSLYSYRETIFSLVFNNIRRRCFFFFY